jgi:hypothetical protein
MEQSPTHSHYDLEYFRQPSRSQPATEDEKCKSLQIFDLLGATGPEGQKDPVFYFPSRIKQVLRAEKDKVRDTLHCECKNCEDYTPAKNDPEGDLVEKFLGGPDFQLILFAILVYIREFAICIQTQI